MQSETSDSTNPSIEELIEEFSISSLRKKRRLIQTIEDNASKLIEVGSNLLERFDSSGDDWAAGWLLQVCQRHNPEFFLAFEGKFKNWFKTASSAEIDFGPLQTSLLEERFEEADRLTSSILRELAGPGAVERGYVYFSEVKSIPGTDLISIDRLWLAYSQGRFGFSTQGRLLDSLNGSYERLWPRIGWKKDGVWTRYPNSFTWSIAAPEGHMPLVNQLRGVRLMDALLNHPSLKGRR